MQQERTSQGPSPPRQVATLELISSNAVVATATAVAGNQVPNGPKMRGRFHHFQGAMPTPHHWELRSFKAMKSMSGGFGLMWTHFFLEGIKVKF